MRPTRDYSRIRVITVLGLTLLVTSGVASTTHLQFVTPVKRSTVSGVVHIVIAMFPPVMRCKVYVDGHLLAASPARSWRFDAILVPGWRKGGQAHDRCKG